MIYRFSRPGARWLILLAVVVVYFVIFPEDVGAILSPLEPLSKAAAGALSVTQAVSPWLYGLAAVALICWTVARVWGRGPA